MVNPEPEPYVHPYVLGKRVEDLMELLRGQRAEMESSPLAAVSYTLTVGLLLDLLPHLMQEHRRMASMVTRDPAACSAAYLHCWRSTRGLAETTQMRDLMVAGDMKVTLVPCYLDWGTWEYTLPEGWNVPKAYPPLRDRIVMHKGGTGACDCGCGRQARGSFWSRLRRALAR